MTNPKAIAVRLATWLALALIVAWPGSGRALLVESGDFIAEIERLRDLTFEANSNLYVAPTNQELSDFGALATTLFSGNIVNADAQATALNYELVQFTDNATNNVYYGLREQLVNNQQTRGWGSYFVNLNSKVDILVETPHVRFDTRSWEIGANAFRQAGALGFLMNGAHRNANGQGTADVAHLPDSIFQEVHKAWNGAFAENTAWSIHGFNDANHNFPAGTDVVLSAGDGSVTPAIVEIDKQFTGAGFLSYAFNTLPANDPLNQQVNDGVDGTTFSSLGGTTNVQGVHSRGLGGNFVHVEMEQSIRFDANNRSLAANALSNAMISLPAPPTVPILAVAVLFFAFRRHRRERQHRLLKHLP